MDTHLQTRLGTNYNKDPEQTINMQSIIASGAKTVQTHPVIIGQVEKYRILSLGLFGVKPNNVKHSNFGWIAITDNQVRAKYLCLPRITTALGS